MTSQSFARPDILWLLLSFPLLIVVTYYGRRRRMAALRRFGQPEAMAILFVPTRRRLYSLLCTLAAVSFLVVALAGPRWGRGDTGVVVGRDLVVVLDFSKSMLADDMRDPDGRNERERWKAARAGIFELLESFRQHGGHRIGLVVFAAKPWIVCPLTSDYDHFALRLDEYDPLAPPREVNPDPDKNEQFPSGTRIGSALREAVAAHDPRFPGYRDILLISDGDDPAADAESEIETGIRAARDAQIPVHTVGVGDPVRAITVVVPRPRGDDEIVGPTRLFEDRLKEIARQTHGEYDPARRERPKLGEFFKTRIEARPSRQLPDDALPQPRERYPWFLVPAFVFLLAAWWMDP